MRTRQLTDEERRTLRELLIRHIEACEERGVDAAKSARTLVGKLRQEMYDANS